MSMTSLRDAQVQDLIAQNERLLAALKSCRLMLYAWKGARKNMGLPDDHGELNDTIQDLESVISQAEEEGR
jgi:hypothetical protein